MSGVEPLPRWRPMLACTLRRVPAALRPQLVDRGSLTDVLRRRCGDGFWVRVSRFGPGRPRRDEAALLGLATGEWALIREVHLMCGQRPQVYARSVIPLTALSGRWRRLRRLGGRSLGALLFRDPCVTRLDLAWTRIGSGQPLYRAALGSAGAEVDAAPLYGRRSRFACGGRQLLVSEFFLPEAWPGD